jgi:hypothetical protein
MMRSLIGWFKWTFGGAQAAHRKLEAAVYGEQASAKTRSDFQERNLEWLRREARAFRPGDHVCVKPLVVADFAGSSGVVWKLLPAISGVEVSWDAPLGGTSTVLCKNLEFMPSPVSSS